MLALILTSKNTTRPLTCLLRVLRLLTLNLTLRVKGQGHWKYCDTYPVRWRWFWRRKTQFKRLGSSKAWDKHSQTCYFSVNVVLWAHSKTHWAKSAKFLVVGRVHLVAFIKVAPLWGILGYVAIYSNRVTPWPSRGAIASPPPAPCAGRRAVADVIAIWRAMTSRYLPRWDRGTHAGRAVWCRVVTRRGREEWVTGETDYSDRRESPRCGWRGVTAGCTAGKFWSAFVGR